MTCGVQFVKWFWTGPWLVTCRQENGHAGEHSEVVAATLSATTSSHS